MDKDFKWKNYFCLILVVSIISSLFNYRISIGWLLGNICYFINDKIVSYKFKNLKDPSIIGNIILFMLIQMAIVGCTSYISWYIGKLTCFISYVVGVICPNIYYTIISVFINK